MLDNTSKSQQWKEYRDKTDPDANKGKTGPIRC